ncbi:unnamed protein product [Ectocarpus sp. CCAP 1310/34]|nr:unnamed protein product [Ectocarpus sp. CCAP 1310/34]
MSLCNPLPHGLLEELGKLAEFKERGLILDRHFETIKAHVKAGNSVAEEQWATQIDGETQGITSSTRLSSSSQQDAGSARGAASSQHPPAATAATAKRKVVDRGKQARESAAKGNSGGNICNAFAIGSGQPLPTSGPESRRPCPHCPMTFVNEQGLGIHVRTQHCSANMSNGAQLRRMLRRDSEGSVLPWEASGPRRCWHVKVNDATGAASLVLQRKRFLDLDLDSDGFMDHKPKETRGAPKRRRYDFTFKAHAVNHLRILQDNAEDLWKEDTIVQWAQNEKDLIAAAADDVKSLLAKQQPKRWVSTLWLTITFRKLVREMYPGDQRAAAFRASFRRRTNIKNKSVEERLTKIERFHRLFRKLPQESVRYRAPDESDVSAITTVTERESRVPMYGQFQL